MCVWVCMCLCAHTPCTRSLLSFQQICLVCSARLSAKLWCCALQLLLFKMHTWQRTAARERRQAGRDTGRSLAIPQELGMMQQSSWMWCCPQGTFDNAWGHVWLSRGQGEMLLAYSRAEAREAVKHPIIGKAAPRNEGWSNPKRQHRWCEETLLWHVLMTSRSLRVSTEVRNLRMVGGVQQTCVSHYGPGALGRLPNSPFQVSHLWNRDNSPYNAKMLSINKDAVMFQAQCLVNDRSATYKWMNEWEEGRRKEGEEVKKEQRKRKLKKLSVLQKLVCGLELKMETQDGKK